VVVPLVIPSKLGESKVKDEHALGKIVMATAMAVSSGVCIISF